MTSLPSNAIDNILTCLPLRDAGRTSILSRRWRYKWANLAYLVLDREMLTGTTQKTEDGLLIEILEVMLLKRVPIVKFVLSLPELKISHRHIDLLVAFLTRSCDLMELTLKLWVGNRRYKLPPSLFSCVELTRLSLEYCVIELPTQFKGFNSLVSLEISHCLILPGVLSDLISSCSLLEELKVRGPRPLEGHIQISAPNLRYLSFTALLPSISFKYTPCLSSCDLWLTEEVPNAFESLHNLVSVERLTIHFYYATCKLAVDSCSPPRTLATTLNHLKTLILETIIFPVLKEVSLFLCLLRSSPNLTKLAVRNINELGVTEVDLEQIMHLLDVQEWSELQLNRLRWVDVCGIFDEEHHLKFIELLLAISPKLETVTVIASNRYTQALQERFDISTKMMRFRRLSPLAEIIYK